LAHFHQTKIALVPSGYKVRSLSKRQVTEAFPSLIRSDGHQSTINPGDRLVLLTSGVEDSLPLADAAISHHGLALQQLVSIPIRRASVGFTVLVADVIPSKEYREIPSSEAFSEELPSKLITPAHPWWYSTIMAVSKEVKNKNGPGYIKLRIRADRGVLGVGILSKDRKRWIDRRYVHAPSAVQEIFLRVPHFADVDTVEVVNGESWQSATGLLEAGTVFYRLEQK
jgi:hypothetical protein